jgi:DNA-nicking Smr family endonuclease
MAKRPTKGGEAPLTGEDLDLWRRVTRDARPLAGREAKPITPLPGTPLPGTPPPGAPAAPAAAAKSTAAQPAPRRPAPPALAPGTVAGVDRRTAERLKRGQLAVEATLDLHGRTQAEAHRAVEAFLVRSQSAGKRCVLIITGRGHRHEDGGVLRRNLPLWLNERTNRARILAMATAQPKHGGAGALYLLLKRQRPE